MRNTPIANPYNFAILLSSVFLITNYEDEVIVILQRPQPFHLCEIHQLSTLTTLFTLSKHTPLFSVFSSFPHTCFSLLLFLLSPKYSMHFPLFFHSTSLLFSSFFPRLPHASPFFIPVSVYHICLPFPSSFSPSFSALTFSSFFPRLPHASPFFTPVCVYHICLPFFSSLSPSPRLPRASSHTNIFFPFSPHTLTPTFSLPPFQHPLFAAALFHFYAPFSAFLPLLCTNFFTFLPIFPHPSFSSFFPRILSSMPAIFFTLWERGKKSKNTIFYCTIKTFSLDYFAVHGIFSLPASI